jgi:D-amino-acid dehydrogenase
MHNKNISTQNTSEKTVVVIGGGIIGIASAYYLQEQGFSVTVLEKSHVASGASFGNCGIVGPSLVFPVPQPGVILKSLKWMLKKDSPLYIQPRLDPSLWRWLVSFALHCNTKSMRSTMDATKNLLETSYAMYQDLFNTHAFEHPWYPKGSLLVFKTDKEFQAHAQANKLMEEYGVGGVCYEGESVNTLEPALQKGMRGGWHYPQDAHIRPDALMKEWSDCVRERGVNIVEHCEVQGFASTHNTLTAVHTTQGVFPCSHVVLANGAWSSSWNKWVGAHIPVQPGKGYSITMDKPTGSCPSLPCFLQERKMVATPWKDGLRLGGTMEFSGYNTHLNQTRIQALRTGAAEYLQHSEGANAQEWFGWRPMTPSGLPLIDISPQYKNLVAAVGHNMIGLAAAPATGKLVSDLIAQKKPFIDPTPYRF